MIDVNAEHINSITEYVNIEALPDGPSAHIIFGTNQAAPGNIVLQRYHQDLAPLVIATGGINRHNGIVEGREFYRRLREGGVPDSAIRYEDRSNNTWQNVEFALPYLQEAIDSGLAVTAVTKWYHRRAINILRTLLPDMTPFYGVAWEPIYDDRPVTRSDWPAHQSGQRRVLREYEEVRRRVADGSLRDVNRVDGAWQ